MISFSGFVMYVMGYEFTSFSLSVKSLTIAGVNCGMDQRASGGKPPVSVAYFRASAFCSSVGACGNQPVSRRGLHAGAGAARWQWIEVKLMTALLATTMVPSSL